MDESKLGTLIEQYCPALSDLHPEDNEEYPKNAIGISHLFADYVEKIVCFLPERRKWAVFDGIVWQTDLGDLLVMELCMQLLQMLIDYANNLNNAVIRENYLKYLCRWNSRRSREALLKDAAGKLAIKMKEFDKNPYLFNCLNGTIDLRTFQLHPHTPEDRLTKVANVKYDPDAQSERWNAFISEIMDDDNEKAAYLQKAMGYALTGDTSRDCFFILYGPSTRNGKGTLMETMQRMMGEYSRTAQPSVITRKQYLNSGGPNEEVARLVGARLVSISEPGKGLHIDEPLVKTLTGGDTVNSRRLYENSFEFKPEFKFFINTNYRPIISDTTLFASGRVKVIPFEHFFAEPDRDCGLEAELAKPECQSAILNWCLHGLQLLQEEGLKEPDSVRDAISEYWQDSDMIGQFISERMTNLKGAEVRSKAAYDIFCEWCEDNGNSAGTQREFTEYFRSLPTATVKTKRPREGGGATTMILGYALKAADLTGEAAS